MTTEQATPKLLLLLIGDQRTGKSVFLATLSEYDPDCLLSPLQNDELPICDIAITKNEINGLKYETLYATNPYRNSSSLLGRTHVCLICFSLVDFESYENVRTKWYPALRAVNNDAVVFLVGTRTDSRAANIHGTRSYTTRGGTDVITYEQGLAMQKEIGAERYFESPSGMAGELFKEAGIAALKIEIQRRAQAVDRRKVLNSCIVV